jgi:hypothetical protein
MNNRLQSIALEDVRVRPYGCCVLGRHIQPDFAGLHSSRALGGDLVETAISLIIKFKRERQSRNGL